MFKLKKRRQDRCDHSYIMTGNKARTIHTPMICTKCGKIEYNDERKKGNGNDE